MSFWIRQIGFCEPPLGTQPPCFPAHRERAQADRISASRWAISATHHCCQKHCHQKQFFSIRISFLCQAPRPTNRAGPQQIISRRGTGRRLPVSCAKGPMKRWMSTQHLENFGTWRGTWYNQKPSGSELQHRSRRKKRRCACPGRVRPRRDHPVAAALPNGRPVQRGRTGAQRHRGGKEEKHQRV